MFSLLLVGVIAASMFSFVAPTNVEATEAGSNGTLSIRNKGWYTAGFHVTFYNFLGDNLGEYDTGYLEGWSLRHTREIKIPKGTYRVHVFMDVMLGYDKTIDFFADESVVNENNRIVLESKGGTLTSRFDVKTDNGWFEEYLESADRGIIQFNNKFLADNPNMYFKVAFYRDSYQQSQKLGEESIKIPTKYEIIRENVETPYYEIIKIPGYTTRIEAEILKDGAPIDSATLEVYRNIVSWEDVIEIDLEWSPMVWKLMDITCSNGWQRVYR